MSMYTTEMVGTGKLAGLPPLSPHQESPVFRAVILGRIPDEGVISRASWLYLVKTDFEVLSASSTGSYFRNIVGPVSVDAIREEVADLLTANYISGDGTTYTRKKKARTFFLRLNPNARRWVERLHELTLLYTLAGAG